MTDQFEPEVDAKVRKHWRRMLDACQSDVLTTVPIFGRQDDKPVHDRSGVLLQIDQSHFIITASHDIQEIARHRVPLYLAPTRQGGSPVPLNATVVGTEDVLRDVAVMLLEPSVVEQLSGRTFLRMTDLDSSSERAEGLYTILGYPHSFSRTDEANNAFFLDPLFYAAYLYRGEPRESFDEDVHLLLRHSKQARNLKGEPTRSPRIGGMSGCGIWRLADFNRGKARTWQPTERRLVAIQTACHHDEYFKGTWIKHALEVIWSHHPALRPAMSLYYPSN